MTAGTSHGVVLVATGVEETVCPLCRPMTEVFMPDINEKVHIKKGSRMRTVTFISTNKRSKTSEM